MGLFLLGFGCVWLVLVVICCVWGSIFTLIMPAALEINTDSGRKISSFFVILFVCESYRFRIAI